MTHDVFFDSKKTSCPPFSEVTEVICRVPSTWFSLSLSFYNKSTCVGLSTVCSSMFHWGGQIQKFVTKWHIELPQENLEERVIKSNYFLDQDRFTPYNHGDDKTSFNLFNLIMIVIRFHINDYYTLYPSVESFRSILRGRFTLHRITVCRKPRTFGHHDFHMI